jgi:hypothetical protein
MRMGADKLLVRMAGKTLATIDTRTLKVRR